MNVSREHILSIQKYENAPKEVIEIKEGNETEDFLKLWFDTNEKLTNFNKKRVSDLLNEWNNWYKDVRNKIIIYIG